MSTPNPTVTVHLFQRDNGEWLAAKADEPLTALGRSQEEALQILGRRLDSRK